MSDIDFWVSAEFERLAEIINEYDPYLFLEYIPPAQQVDLIDKQKCFRIVDDRNKKPVMYFASVANPKEILTRLFCADLNKGDVVGRMESANRASQILDLKRREDEQAAARDLSAFVIKNTKSRWYHDGRIRDDEFRDLGPVRKVVE